MYWLVYSHSHLVDDDTSDSRLIDERILRDASSGSARVAARVPEEAVRRVAEDKWRVELLSGDEFQTRYPC